MVRTFEQLTLPEKEAAGFDDRGRLRPGQDPEIVANLLLNVCGAGDLPNDHQLHDPTIGVWGRVFVACDIDGSRVGVIPRRRELRSEPGINPGVLD